MLDGQAIDHTAGEQPATDLVNGEAPQDATGPRAAPVDHSWRLARAQEARDAHRDRQNAKAFRPWHPDRASPDHDPLPVPALMPHRQMAANGEVIVRERRALRDADLSVKLFGRTRAGLPHFDEPTAAGAIPPELQHLTVLARIDVDRTLNGQATGISFRSGAQRRSGSRRVARGPGRAHPISLAILELADRGGLFTGSIAARYAWPNRSPQTVRDHLRDLLKHGLIEFATVTIRDHVDEGPPPRLYHLTEKGWRYLAGHRRTRRVKYRPEPRLSATALARAAHHIGAVSYAIALIDTLPYVTPFWCTPAWPDAHIEVPWTTDRYTGRKRPLRLDDHRPGTADGVIGLTDAQLQRMSPDVLLELAVPTREHGAVPVPLLVEYDRTADVRYNLEKLLVWECFRVAWARDHPAFRRYGEHLGALLFVARDRHFLLRLMYAADQGHTTARQERIDGLAGAVRRGPDDHYFAGRENLYFALEEDVYRASTRAFQIPPLPPHVRHHVGQPTAFRFHRTELLPPVVGDQSGTQGRNWTGEPWRPSE